MLSIPGNPGSTCDGWSRREFIRVGGAGLFGVGLGDVLKLQALAAESASDATKSKAGWGKAKSVVLLFLQGGPSHLDIWDPKPEAPSNIRGEFKTLRSKVPGIWLSEVMPKLAEQMDKATLIRSVSYTPAGLFNHTAAIYQMMTGYTPDRVSPSGQLEPPAPNDFPHAGSQITRLHASDLPMFPFVMMPRPLQESNVIGKGGTAGFLGPAFDPYYFYQDPAKEIKLDDLSLREGISKERMERRETLLKKVEAAMPEMEKAVSNYALDKYYRKAFELVLSGRARNALPGSTLASPGIMSATCASSARSILSRCCRRRSRSASATCSPITRSAIRPTARSPRRCGGEPSATSRGLIPSACAPRRHA